MPRQARRKSNSGIYHIMLRGINQQIIFEDDEDRERLIETLVKYREISGYKVYAYCLMGNHFHLLLKTEDEDLDLIVKRIAGSYVYWYNRKYRRSGHLFQDRYRSEPVEDERYFLAVLRYIHHNPVKAGMTKGAADYEYSSYGHLIKGKPELLDQDYVFSILEKDEYEEFHKEENDNICMDFEEKEYPLNDEEAIKLIKSVAKCEEMAQMQSFGREQLARTIKQIKEKGLSIRQISRLTGISKGMIEKVLRQ